MNQNERINQNEQGIRRQDEQHQSAQQPRDTELFYDIESTPNVFLLSVCQVSPDQRDDIFYLIDDPAKVCSGDWRRETAKRIREKNRNFAQAAVYYHDLSQERSMRDLVNMFGCSTSYSPVAPPDLAPDHAQPSQTGENEGKAAATSSDGVPYAPPHVDMGTFDQSGQVSQPQHLTWLLGFNSYNYDVTMIAWLFSRVRWSNGQVAYEHPSAADLRVFNNRLFRHENKGQMAQALGGPDEIASRIRHNMIKSGTNIDVARLNEKQSHAGLKRLLGILGCQILESDKISGDQRIENTDQLADLIAYNASDCVNLAVLFHQRFYQAQFVLKRGLLRTYPQLVWWPSEERVPSDMHASDVKDYRAFPSAHTMRGDRLASDSRSAQFAIMALCPYGHLSDLPHVDLHYPVVMSDGSTQSTDVLEMARTFFLQHIDGTSRAAQDARDQFQHVYEFYDALRGKNFNASQQYASDFGRHAETVWSAAQVIRDFARLHANDDGVGGAVFLPYYLDAEGTESDCYVMFSVGGLHGAQHAVGLDKANATGTHAQLSLLDQLADASDDPGDLKQANPCGVTLAKNGNLDIRYAVTSAGIVWHEDFTSYYPSMLRKMKAFANPGLGIDPDGQPVDRYGQLFEQKQLYKRLMNDPAKPQEERTEYRIRREGVKLLLNSASGAGAAPFENAIRMDNRILSMRIIGQLFTWMIGQSLSLEGGRVVSTNTDGLYVSFDPIAGDEDAAQRNGRGLRRVADRTGVEIDPERCGLISKDANNRLEFDPTTRTIANPAGGTLSCALGPDPTKALNHPAAIDHLLAQVLLDAEANEHGFDVRITHDQARAYVDRMIDGCDREDSQAMGRMLQMLQVIIAASPSVHNWPFLTRNPDENLLDHDPSDQALQQYNRVFLVDRKRSEAAAEAIGATPMHLLSAACRANARGGSKRSAWIHAITEPDYDPIPDSKSFAIQKITGIDPSWWVIVINGPLFYMTREQAHAIIDAIDRDVYATMLEHTFNANWSNAGKIVQS